MVDELKKMNADIERVGSRVLVNGKAELYGAEVTAPDLRGGASLIIAGLGADGVTTVSGLDVIKRGYDRIDEKLRILGGSVNEG